MHIKRVQSRLRLCPADPVFQPAHQVEPSPAAVVHRDITRQIRQHRPDHRYWHTNVRRNAYFDALKTRGRDADDGHRMPIEPDRLSDDARIGSEPPSPERVTEYHHWLAARPTRVVGRECTAARAA